MADLQIRQLTATDAAAYRKLRLKALKESPRAFGSDWTSASALSMEQFAERVTPQNGLSVNAAFDGVRLIATLTLMRNQAAKSQHIAHLYGMFVDPGYRGRGVARALLERAIAKARAMPGVSQLELEVAVDNLPALHLYEEAGFAPWGRHPRALIVDGEAVDEYAMLLDVS